MSSAPSDVQFARTLFVTNCNNAFVMTLSCRVTTLSSRRTDEIQEACRMRLFLLSSSVTGGLGKGTRSSGLERCQFCRRSGQPERADPAVAADLSTFCLP